MRILKMTACFGKLSNETLTLAPGMNLICLPNEGGKSTWSAFLLAMLYGVDTAERSAKGAVPVKTKYLPWDNCPMQGTVELLFKGQRITLERTTRGRTPMGAFRAYDSESGQDVAWLTGENCGQTLLGVERSVFERSAFFSQHTLRITSDAALEKRLAALVSTADEGVSFSETEQRLRKLQNGVRHNKTGLLPQAQAELSRVELTLSQIAELQRRTLSLAAREDELAAEQTRLCGLEAALSRQKAHEQLLQRQNAEKELAAATERKSAQLAGLQRLPDENTLHGLLEKLHRLAPQDGADAVGDPEKMRRDVQSFDALCAGKEQPFGLMAALGGLCLAACLAALFFAKIPAAAVIFGILTAVFGVFAVLSRKNNRLLRQNRAEAEALLRQYGKSRDEILQLAAALELKRQQAAARSEEQAHLLGQISMLAGEVHTAADGEAVLQDCLRRYAEARRLAAEEASAREKLEAISRLTAHLTPDDAPVEEIGMTEELLLRQKAQCQAQLRQVRSELDRANGAAAALGDTAALFAQKEQLLQRIAELEEKYAAVSAALSALCEANAQMQSRFSPQLCRLAGQYFSQLTGGKYDSLLLSSSLTADAHEAQSGLMRSLPYLSSGAGEQLYLAVRLAMCELLLPEDCPVVLDDALVRFDDERLRTALALLKQQDRQILLFTCQDREQRILKEG